MDVIGAVEFPYRCLMTSAPRYLEKSNHFSPKRTPTLDQPTTKRKCFFELQFFPLCRGRSRMIPVLVSSKNIHDFRSKKFIHIDLKLFHIEWLRSRDSKSSEPRCLGYFCKVLYSDYFWPWMTSNDLKLRFFEKLTSGASFWYPIYPVLNKFEIFKTS